MSQLHPETNPATTHLATPLARELVNHETLWLRNFISKQTQRAYTCVFRDFCQFLGVDTPEAFRAVTAAQIIAYRDYLIDTKAMKPRSVRNRLAALSSLFKHLKNEQVIQINPVENIQRPRIANEHGSTPAMTAPQVRKLLDAPDITTLQGARDSAILHALGFTACRIAELTALKVGDLYEDQGYFLLLFTVKGGKEHAVEVHHELQQAIRRYLAIADHGTDPNSPLFMAVKRGRNQGRPLHKDHFAWIFEKYRSLAGLPKTFTPHSLRATCATVALENGANLEDVQRLLSHADIRTTQIYDKRRFNHKDSAAFAVRY
jgi:site-specific recombinase XerD